MAKIIFKRQRTFINKNNGQTAVIEAEIKEVTDGIHVKTLKEITKPMYTLSLNGSLYRKGTRGEPRPATMGQIYSSIENARSFEGGEDLVKLIKIWKEYHLNDLTPGTARQMRRIATLKKNQSSFRGAAVDYEEAKHAAGIDQGYVFGTSWLVKPIPNHVLATVRAIMKRVPREIWEKGSRLKSIRSKQERS